MVFIGGWRSRRRGYGGGPYGGGPYGRGPFGGGYGPGYGGGFGGGGGGCLRDMMLVEGGCCLAEMLGCGPQLLLVIPSTLRRPHLHPHLAHSAGERPAKRTARERVLAWVLSLISTYQREISPRRRACCRYSPTCSHYAAEALSRHGLWRGGALAARRLLRCRPGSAGGSDPVPLAA